MAHEESCTETATIEIKDEENNSKTSSPRHGNPGINKEDEELESAKAEMGEVREENERLKQMLDKIENDYRSLQMHFLDLLQRDRPPKSAGAPAINEFEHPQTSLCLGKSPVESGISNEITNRPAKGSDDPKLKVSDGLTLGLDLLCSSETGQSGTETADPRAETKHTKEDELGETWSSGKVPKTPRSESKEPTETNIAKRARVSIRSRCETPTMHDGCQWRKYGQKTAKGNPCPRAYYRCTIAPTCPVRKQVQRCSEDMSILITTYEGTHNHPLPVAATAMASTTSAAASMLMSRSSTSQGPVASSSAPATATTANINGLNFTIFDNTATRPFNFPHASSLAPPTITLDLTSNPSSHLINRFSQAPKFPFTSLDFSSSSEPMKPLMPWGGNSHLSYNPSPLYNNKTTPVGTLDFANRPNGSAGPLTNTHSSNQQLLTDTIAKVLTSAPSFQQALAAAISNMAGSGNFTNSWRATAYNGETTMLGSMGNGDQRQVSAGRVPYFTSHLSNPSQLTTPTTSSSAKGGSFGLLQPLIPMAPSNSSSPMASNIEANNSNR